MTTSTFSIILVVIASGKISFKISLLIKNFQLYIGFFFFGIAALLSIIALRNGELNVLYPISSLSYVWSLFIGKKFLNEEINIYKWGGISLIIMGLIFIVN